jgi:hypothetical protein
MIKSSASQIGMGKLRQPKIRSVQISTCKIRPFELCAIQTSSQEIGTSKRSVVKYCEVEICATQAGSLQAGTRKVDAIERHLFEPNFVEMHSAKLYGRFAVAELPAPSIPFGHAARSGAEQFHGV